MIKPSQQAVIYVDSRGAVQKDLTAPSDWRARRAVEAARVAAVLASGAVPEDCGPEIRPAPARGGFVLQRVVEVAAGDDGKLSIVNAGHEGRAAIRVADVFDRMQAQALRAKRPMALTGQQVDIGRRYRDLVQALDAGGYRLSSLEGRTASGSASDGGDWMDRRLQMSAELDQMRRRIGHGVALQVRRVRPSRRAVVAAGEDPRCIFTDRDIIDLVCVQDMSCGDLLRHYRWQSNGRNRKVVLDALCAALERMTGNLA